MSRVGQPRRQERGQADHAGAPDRDAGARRGAEDVQDGAGAGLDAAAQRGECLELLPRHVRELDEAALPHQTQAGQGALAEEEIVQALAVLVCRCGGLMVALFGGGAGGGLFTLGAEVQREDLLAVGLAARETAHALAAVRVGQGDCVAGLDVADGGTDLLH